MSNTQICDCHCHTSAYAACDTPGGCGSTGCRPAGKQGSCVTCGLYRPDSPAREPHRPPVCDGDRALLDRHLADVANLTADLSNPEPPIVDQRRYERFDRSGDSLGETWADPLTAVGGVAPINSRSSAPAVSGSRERPIPIAVTVVDLQAPARHIGDPRWPNDQVGNLSAATALDSWVRDIRDTLYPGHHLPPATVDEMVTWMRNRIEGICDRHPAVDDFAEEIRALRSVLRSAAGVIDTKPERCDGVPCRRCDLMTLFRQPGGDVACINPDCQAILREDEYAEWTKTLADQHRVRRHAATTAQGA